MLQGNRVLEFHTIWEGPESAPSAVPETSALREMEGFVAPPSLSPSSAAAEESDEEEGAVRQDVTMKEMRRRSARLEARADAHRVRATSGFNSCALLCLVFALFYLTGVSLRNAASTPQHDGFSVSGWCTRDIDKLSPGRLSHSCLICSQRKR